MPALPFSPILASCSHRSGDRGVFGPLFESRSRPLPLLTATSSPKLLPRPSTTRVATVARVGRDGRRWVSQTISLRCSHRLPRRPRTWGRAPGSVRAPSLAALLFFIRPCDPSRARPFRPLSATPPAPTRRPSLTATAHVPSIEYCTVTGVSGTPGHPGQGQGERRARRSHAQPYAQIHVGKIIVGSPPHPFPLPPLAVRAIRRDRQH